MALSGIPLRIRNSFAPSGPGTLVANHIGAARLGVKAITTRKQAETGIVSLFVDTRDEQIAIRATAALDAAGVGFTLAESKDGFSIIVPGDDLASCVRLLHREFDLGSERRQNRFPNRYRTLQSVVEC